MNKYTQHLLTRYVHLLNKRLWYIFGIIAVITIASTVFASKLELRSNLKELLPQDSPSVQALDHAIEKVGGVGNLIVAIESPDLEANKRFADEMARRLTNLPKGYIRYIDYRSDDVENFYNKYALLYMNTTDLEDLSNRLKRKIEYEKLRRSSLFIDFGDEDLSIDVDDFKKKYDGKFAAPVQSIDGYFGGYDGNLLIMLIRPYGANMSIDFTRELISKVKQVESDINPSSYNPQMKIGYTGTFMGTIEEYEVLKGDLLKTALLCILLVAGAITLYFFRIRPVIFLGSTLLIALSWTFALTKLTIGYLNAQTAFLGAIIMGTGINYGIILFSRYFEERRKHHGPSESLLRSLKASVLPTFLAALTTAAAFGVLFLAGVRSLSQFGFIGFIGINLCWIASMIVLPILLLASERLLTLLRLRRSTRRRRVFFERLSHLIITSPRAVVMIAAIAVLLSAITIAGFAKDSIEYDFSKLRNKTSIKSGTDALDRRVGKLFKHSTIPTVIYANSAAEAKEVCDVIHERIDSQPEEERRVESCQSVDMLVPKNQDKNISIIMGMRELLDDPILASADSDTRKKVEKAKTYMDVDNITIHDLPQAITRHFVDLDGNLGTIAFVSPKKGKWLSDGRNLIAFANTIRDVRLSNGHLINPAGDAVVYADLIQIIKREAPFLTLISLLAVLAVIILVLRKLKPAMIIITSLLCGVIIMLGVAALFEIRINFFNFIVLPLTFGIAADYSLNLGLRTIRDRECQLSHILRNTGGAVILCSATTIIGYYVLTRANNQALASFGTAAVIGEISCILTTIFLLPALAILIDRSTFLTNIERYLTSRMKRLRQPKARSQVMTPSESN